MLVGPGGDLPEDLPLHTLADADVALLCLLDPVIQSDAQHVTEVVVPPLKSRHSQAGLLVEEVGKLVGHAEFFHCLLRDGQI